jgi:enediyne biosynthesis protein E4
MLPVEVQFAPVNTILCHDFDNDGHIDLLLAGNEYQTDVMTGRYDASYGLLLKGNSDNTFVAQPPSYSGFITNGDVKNMKLLHAKDHQLVLVAANNDSLQAFGIQKK